MTGDPALVFLVARARLLVKNCSFLALVLARDSSDNRDLLMYEVIEQNPLSEMMATEKAWGIPETEVLGLSGACYGDYSTK